MYLCNLTSGELWGMLIEAQSSEDGIPTSLVEKKMKEIQKVFILYLNCIYMMTLHSTFAISNVFFGSFVMENLLVSQLSKFYDPISSFSVDWNGKVAVSVLIIYIRKSDTKFLRYS